MRTGDIVLIKSENKWGKVAEVHKTVAVVITPNRETFMSLLTDLEVMSSKSVARRRVIQGEKK